MDMDMGMQRGLVGQMTCLTQVGCCDCSIDTGSADQLQPRHWLS